MLACAAEQNVAGIVKKQRKPPQNGFAVFLNEQFSLLRQNNKSLRKSDIVSEVHDKWQVLEPMQRLSYEKLAIQSNKGRSRRQGQTDVTPISGNGTLVFDALSKEREEQGIKLFKEMWSSLKGPAGTIFHILSFQSIYELPNEEGYKPCEVACIKYSIERGIIGEWHQFINPGAIELGLRAEVQVHTEKTHRISEDLYSQGRDDYRNIWKELFLFTGSDVENSLLCMENEIRKNCFCLHWLAEKAGYNNHFGVYGFESITSALYGYTEPVCLSPILITAGCNSSMFDYELGIKCEYHEEIECTCCTLLTVKRCCYWMTNTFSGIYNVDITESHLPVKSQSSFSEVCLV